MMERFPRLVDDEERREIEKFFLERFGISPQIFENYFFLKGSSNYWLFPRTEYLDKLNFFHVQTVGLLFLRKVSRYLKPTSAFLQRFGYLAKKNVVQLNSQELRHLVEKNKIPYSLDTEPGYVILKYNDWILGCGLYIEGKLISYLEERVKKSLTLSLG